MEHPYAPFIDWSLRQKVPGLQRNGVMTTTGKEWLCQLGVVAGRVDRYLAKGHPGARIMPNSLVMDILELELSPYADFAPEDPRRALIDTWSGLADVYGTPPSNLQELTRLNLLADWAEAITTPVGGSYPGQHQLKICFPHEMRRVDLTKMDGQPHDPELLDNLLKLLKMYPCVNTFVLRGIDQ
ncbi:hypothetical protein H9638_05945 [Arthrobacter sp. Sa2BUA2]|uniref:Uncharacterized protein n=1 Tax=Arthrobacter pullicola TaxID=2762224 RepID=A0ABR8YGK0_9MICC|nr:hypothetical protein [Arthrobacter pullicola]MBD8043352.1 hypothetical protein [Arthrobacter pullicola]